MANNSKARLQLNRLSKDIKNSFQKTLSANNMGKLGNESIRLIVKRVRLGFGVNSLTSDKARKTRLKKLSANYIEERKRLRKQGSLDSSTRPNKSNLTKTGQMLRSMKVIKKNKGFVEIGPTGSRKGENLTNEKLAEYVQDQGRPWLNLTALERKQVLRYYQNKILRPVLVKI